jgi:hypothetical protein
MIHNIRPAPRPRSIFPRVPYHRQNNPLADPAHGLRLVQHIHLLALGSQDQTQRRGPRGPWPRRARLRLRRRRLRMACARPRRRQPLAVE